VKPGLKRRAASLAIRSKYNPLVELLEDRYAPGSVLGLSSDVLAGSALSLKLGLGESGAESKTRRFDQSDSISILQQETAPPAKRSVAVQNTSGDSGKSSLPTSVSQVFARSSESSLVNIFGSLSTPEAAELSIKGIASSVGGSAGVTGELPKAGSLNRSGGSSEMVQMGSVLTVGSSPMGGEDGQGSGNFARAATASTTNGYGSNVGDLGGPVTQGTPSSGIFPGDGSFDVRTPYITGQRVGLNQQQLAALQNLQGTLNGLRVNVNTIFGTPSSLINNGSYLTQPSTLPARDVVQQFIYANRDALGLTEADVQDLVTTDLYTNTIGAPITHVYLQQEHNGIPVFHGVANGSVTSDGRLIMLGNHLVRDLAGSVNTTTPTINQAQAIFFAAQSMGIQITQPLGLIDNTGGPTQAQTYISAEVSRGEIPVALRYLPIQNGETRLVWHTVIESPLNENEWYEINVDAQTGKVWNRFNYYKDDSYRVLKYNLEGPHDGGFTVQVNPADPLANGFPNLTVVSWHNTDGDPEPETFTSTGNNVIAQEDRDGDNSPIGRRPAPNGNTTGTNDYNYVWDPTREPYEPPIPFDPGPPPVPGQPAYTNNMFAAIVQGYYSTNIFHDILYYYGFTEAAGNFQIFNFGRGGRANDPVLLDVQDDHDNGTTKNANYATPPDGTPGRMQMFVFDFTTPNRDASMYAEILYHELGHGWTTRLVGGPSNVTGLSGIQSGGMGEGWSDYVTLWMTTTADQKAGDTIRYGRHILGQGSNGLGVRRLPYDSTIGTHGRPNTYDNPITYNDIDPVQEDVVWPFNPPIDPRLAGADEIHNVGELLCQTLWDFTWAMTKKYGFSSDLYRGQGGNNFAMKIVNEALRLTPINPTFLNYRDAMLAADVALYGGANQLEIWTAFAARGMGQFANDGGDHNSTAVRENFTIPPIPPTNGGGGGGGGNLNYPGNGNNDGKYEPNNFSNQAYNLGGFKTGTKQFAGLKIKDSTQQDRDWFRFKTKNSGSTTVQIDMASNAGDLDLIVYRRTNNGTLQEIDRSSNRGDGGSEAVTFNAQAGVQYLFQVLGYNGDTGNYGITITAP